VVQVFEGLLVDIGGVLGTNGWDRAMRGRAAAKFGLDLGELDERHQQAFDTYEEGKISLEEYLNRIVFYEKRPFSVEDFIAFMFEQSVPYPDTIELVRKLKARYRLKVVVVSNEGRELTFHRIPAFGLDRFVDVFVVSSFVHLRKPDPDIFRLALDVSHLSAESVMYIEDRPLFVEVARSIGIRGIRHVNAEATGSALAAAGLDASG
jgi:putative hydrolase of the HAD superfamily